jgi:murein L,D-transpeptidase YcbB/YkuD
VGITDASGRAIATMGASRRGLGITADAAQVVARRMSAAALLVLLLGAPGSRAAAEDEVASAIRAALTPQQASAHPALQNSTDERSLAQRLYEGRRYTGLWTQGLKMTSQGQQTLLLLSHSEDLGLKPDDYSVEPLMAAGMRLTASGTASPALAAAFDIQLTESALRYIHDTHFGRIDPRQVGFELDVPRQPFDSTAALLDMARAESVARVAASIEPQFYHYSLLKKSLSQYRALARDPPPFLITPSHPIKVGSPYAQAPALRQMLIRLGDLPPGSTATADPLVFDAPLSAAIRRFQARHGLKVDGVLRPPTSRALSVPMAARVRQITLTLERWRWVPEFSAPPLIVNIPQFRLFAFNSLQDRKSDVLQMDVIVGRAFRTTHTPIFAAAMTSVIFRPYWQVPDSIVRKEMIPKIERERGYLEAQHLDIVPNSDEISRPLPLSSATLSALSQGHLKLRQRPGPENALGLVKFSLPNPHDVYLHSTPTPALFKEAVRAFSHGCIRVSDPVALAVHVLRDTPGAWSAQRVREAMDGAMTQHVRLAHPIPVLILYGTAFATEDGRILFFDDIYGHDRRLAALLGL